MADDKPTAPRAGGARRRRQASTIDLTATEVEAEATSPAPKAASVEPDGSAAPSLSSGAEDAPRSARRGTNPFWRQAGAAVLGGGVVALLLCGIWLAYPAGREQNDAGVRAQVAALQAQLHELSQPKPASQPIDPAGAERLVAIENAIKAAGIALAALTKRSDDIAGNAAAARERAEAAAKSASTLEDAFRKMPAPVNRDDVNMMQARMAALESAAKATQDKVAQSSEADAAARLALAAIALRDTVMRGEPYETELAAAEALGADKRMLAPLEQFAAKGTPDDVTLLRELSALLPKMRNAVDADPATAGFIDRLQANAAKLVRIQPLDAPVGADPAAVLARIEISAAHNDVSGARTELARLPEGIRALAANWNARVSARQAALSASRAMASDAARALTAR